MNYLAHAFLSFNDPEILVGNMISDYVKGKKQFDYPYRIQQGIRLHRLIDTYTDQHPATKEAKKVFRSAYRLYSGAMVDVAYDHFLARDEEIFTQESLFAFSQQVYSTLDRHTQWMPAPFAGMFPYMKRHNWLYHYRTLEGTEKSFFSVVRRAVYLEESDSAAAIFRQYYQLLEDCYRLFWADLQPFIFTAFSRLEEDKLL